MDTSSSKLSIIKREPRLLKQVSLELITIMPRLQFKLLDKESVAISNYNT